MKSEPAQRIDRPGRQSSPGPALSPQLASVAQGLTLGPTSNFDRYVELGGAECPRILDLFCGAGGAAVGYHRAGFEVVGVDHEPQPRYPFPFVEADALDFLRGLVAGGTDVLGNRLRDYAAIHASPPCQAYSVSKSRPVQRKKHPELIEPCRDLLVQSGRPWIIENVPGAPLQSPALLCGSMFGLTATCADGTERPLRRHRLFEASFLLLSPGCYCGKTEKIGVYGNGGRWANRFDPDRKGYKGCVSESRQCMGIDWMTIAELSQAIPPAYTQYIGKQLLDLIQHTTRPDPLRAGRS